MKCLQLSAIGDPAQVIMLETAAAPRLAADDLLIYRVLADLTIHNSLAAKVDGTYALDRYKDALAHAQRVHGTGKVLLQFE